MDLELALRHRNQVEEFRKRHRTGLVTLLFTDIAGSTQIKQALGDRTGAALIQQHRVVVRETLRCFKESEEIETAGDSFFIVFVKPSDATRFSLLLQARLREVAQESPPPIRLRIGIHIGEVVIEEHENRPKPKDLYGIQVDLCARVMSLASGDQILLTRSAFDNARQALKGEDLPGLGELVWLNHGTYVIAGLDEPLEICEVGEVGLAFLQRPADAAKAKRKVSPDEEPVLGWRPAVSQIVPGTPWLLERKLGEGGFGEVWLGRHRKLQERRVFKFCFRADRVRSLKREMTLFRVIKERIGDHPNIVRLVDVYFDEAPFYVVMDYCEGESLSTWCEQQGGIEKIPLRDRLEIVAQIADALQAAHEAGVIHRDVKPSNILVSSSRLQTPNHPLQVKLTDFGIGQIISEETLTGVTKAGFTQTLSNESSSSQTGSQLYMAPEVLAGKPASTRSDIYSLGIVLYQLLVGDFARPLTADWTASGVNDLLRDDLRRCFAGNPEDRFAGAAELGKNLRRLDHRKAARKLFGALIGACLSVFVGIGVFVSPLGDSFAKLNYDWPHRVRPSTVINDVVIVHLDEQSHQALHQSFSQAWDRTLHARLLDRARADGARAVVFDMAFVDRTSPAADHEFAKAIKSFGKVVLAADRVFTEGRAGLRGPQIVLPQDVLMDAAAAVGTAEIVPDSDLVARTHPFYNPATDLIPTLSYAAAKLAGAAITKNEHEWPGVRGIHYYGPAGFLPSVSYFRALNTNDLAPGFFRNKIVFVASRAGPVNRSEIKNAYRSPYATGWRRQAPLMSHAEIQATLMLNLLRGDWLSLFPRRIDLLFLTLTGLGLGVVSMAQNKRALTLAGLGLLVVVIVLTVFTVREGQFVIPWLIVAAVQLPVLLIWWLFFQFLRVTVEIRR